MELKQAEFSTASSLTKFINSEKIKQSDIQAIVRSGELYTVFYWKNYYQY